jgi:hypothetical protein
MRTLAPLFLGAMLAVGKLIGSIFSKLLTDECKAWLPWLTRRLLAFAVNRLPQRRRERYEEEWNAHIAEIPGELSKFVTAVSIIFGAVRMRIVLTRPHFSPSKRDGENFAWSIGWDVTLAFVMGASPVASGWSNHFIDLLELFHLRMPLWLAFDHWTGLRTCENIVAQRMAHAADPSLVAGTSAFLDRVAAITAGHSPALVQQADQLLDAPRLFGVSIGFNLSAYVIVLLISAVLRARGRSFGSLVSALGWTTSPRSRASE